jgi:mannose-1-phosphate guanylyltransferase
MIPATDFMADYFTKIRGYTESISVDQIAAVADHLLSAYRLNQQVLVAGNGGSAATASHLAADLAKNVINADTPSARRPRVRALTDNMALISALANDLSYEAIFSEQVKTWGQPGDTLIVISASGNSPNIIDALKAARELDMYTIGLLGFDGGCAREMVDLAVLVPSFEYGPVEDFQLMFGHMVTAFLKRAIAEDTLLQRPSACRVGRRAPRAVVLAAGKGTRMYPLTIDCPKPMLPIHGRPLLEHTLMWLRDHKITEIAINLHHGREVICERIGSGGALGVHISYSHEDTLLGTAGAIRRLQPFLEDGPFVVVYGDVLTDLDLHALLERHQQVRQRDPLAGITMSLYRVPNPTEVGLVDVDATGRIMRFVEKPSADQVFTDLASAGVLVIEPDVIPFIPPDTFYDLGTHLFPQLMAAGVSMYGWEIPDETYLLDIGTPEKYAQAQLEWPARRPALHLVQAVG